jgi:hypothetical protein
MPQSEPGRTALFIEGAMAETSDRQIRSSGERWAQALVIAGIAVVWSGIGWAAIVQLIVRH